MSSWTEYMMAHSQVDKLAREISAVLLLVWLLIVGMRYHAAYPKEFVHLAGHPLWRLLLVVGTAAAAIWCPRVGILAAIAVVLYLADMRSLTGI